MPLNQAKIKELGDALAPVEKNDLLKLTVKDSVQEAENYISSAEKLKDKKDADAKYRLSYEACHMLLVCILKTEGYQIDSKLGHRITLINLHPDLAPPSKPDYVERLSKAHFSRNRAAYGISSPTSFTPSAADKSTLADELLEVAKDILTETKIAIKPWLK